jgi:polar amino acid transport system substrate-binding protein
MSLATHPSRRFGRAGTLAALPAVVLLGTAALAGCADPGASAAGSAGGGAETTTARNGVVYNTAPDQQRIRAEKDAALAAKVPELIGKDGKLTIATTAGSIPLSFHATDDKTPIGSELDIAQLVADKLGLELDVQVTSWENWPLKTQSGDFEAVFSNVGVNKDRVKLFDFASYRAAFMGFEAKKSATYDIKGADDISGLKVSVGSGTNQEKILLAWNKELEGKGKPPATLQYYSSDADTILALSSGRTDLNIAPYPSTVYRENTRDDLKVVGKVNAGWPSETLVAATTLRGNGLAPVVTEALNSAIEDGSYGKVLERWGLSEEALPESKTINEENFSASQTGQGK